MSRKDSFVYIACFCLYFAIHYLEGLPPIGGVSVAQVWKIPIILFLLCYNLAQSRKKQPFEKWGYALSIEYLLGAETWVNLFGAINRVARTMPVFLFYGFWVEKLKKKKELLETFIFSLAQFIPLASILILSGAITPLKEYESAESFGVEGLAYYSCVFGSAHAASSYFCASILVLVFGFLNKRFKSRKSKIFNALLICVSLISIFKAYTRTGWLMLLVGGLALFMPSKITFNKMLSRALLLLVIGGGLMFFFNENEAFQARLTGRNIYTHTGGGGIETNGSGRTAFWANAVEGLWSSDNPYYTLFGEGFTNVAERNYRTTGMKVFSHNQFFDALSQNGIIGLLILIGFFIAIYKFIAKRKGPYQHLCYGLFFSNLIFAFFQNEMYFDYAIILSLGLAILQLDYLSSTGQSKAKIGLPTANPVI